MGCITGNMIEKFLLCGLLASLFSATLNLSEVMMQSIVSLVKVCQSLYIQEQLRLMDVLNKPVTLQKPDISVDKGCFFSLKNFIKMFISVHSLGHHLAWFNFTHS